MTFLADVGKIPGARTTVFLYSRASTHDGHTVAPQFGAASVISSITAGKLSLSNEKLTPSTENLTSSGEQTFSE